MSNTYGYLLVHFVENAAAHEEKIYFSLSAPGDPLTWERLNNGNAILESKLGTTGVRDPYFVRGKDAAYIIATDLRVWREQGPDWDEFVRSGSRNLIVWRSENLVDWSEPWEVEVVQPNAGMAWAPEAFYDAATDEFNVYWSSQLYSDSDPEHTGDSHSRIMTARTKDFTSFSPAEVLVGQTEGDGVIDLTLTRTEEGYHFFLKGEKNLLLFQMHSPDFRGPHRIVASRIASDLHSHLEGPLIFKHEAEDVWYLWLDQYCCAPQGYVPFRTKDLLSGEWEPVPPEELTLPAATKHGVVAPLTESEWRSLAARFHSAQPH